MQNISGVFILDTTDILEHRSTKHGVCVSISENKYFFINTKHRDIYNDFEIKASDYKFLKNTNRFVNCSKIYCLDSNKIIKKVGNLNAEDMSKIIVEVQKSETLSNIEIKEIVHDIENWLSNKTT
jgi:mRNA-degrading endonuclease toxin of MazEF toxin-antitoxin module